MNPWHRYFHGEYRAARAYLLEKVFLVLVALDTFLLMIGHAGRYGVDGFNVAHFDWLDRVQPQPTATLYIAVLLLAGLLALSIAFAGSHPVSRTLLFLLYTYSWSMSMLDSYQHHYFVSAVLLCLVFFPRLSAADVHALPAATTDHGADKKKRKQDAARQRARAAEVRGWWYVGACLVALTGYALVARLDAPEHPFVLFGAAAAVLALATFLYEPRRPHPPQHAHAFGYNLLGVTIAIVYTYTSIAKMDAQWIDGHTLRRISSAERVFAPLVEWFAALGMPTEQFWSLLATSVIPMELAVAVGYLLAPRLDRSSSKLLRVTCGITWLLAMSVHLGAEAMGLEIGWFSYYMLFFACVYLLPGPVVDKLVTLLTWPARALSQLLDDPDASRAPLLALSAVVAMLLALIGKLIDLPGASAAGSIAAAALLLCAARLLQLRALAHLQRVLLAAGLSATLMWLAIAQSSVRWDFYRYLGGDLARRGNPQAALETYLRGERYAPPGQSRRNKINALKSQLAAD